jgi:hypothetical protein
VSDKLNTLEQEIVRDEDSAESKRWAQAQEVVRRLDADETQREVAASWINGRTGQPYSHKHVEFMARLWREFGKAPSQDRPPFTVAYDKASNMATTRTERVEAQAPRSEATAQKLVENLLSDKTPPEVRKAVTSGLMQDPELRRQAVAAADAARDEQTKDMREKARARDHAQRDHLAWMNIETEFDKVSRALKNSLLLVRECALDDEARELLTERAHELRASLEVLTMALAGVSTVDWDAELAKLDTKGA